MEEESAFKRLATSAKKTEAARLEEVAAGKKRQQMLREVEARVGRHGALRLICIKLASKAIDAVLCVKELYDPHPTMSSNIVPVDGYIPSAILGEPVEATLTEPLYAFDRVVVPAGSQVLGHVTKVDPVSHQKRMRAILAGDFTPLRESQIEFDTLVFTWICTWLILGLVLL